MVCAQYLIVGVRALYFVNVVFACGALAAAFVGYFSVLSIALSLQSWLGNAVVAFTNTILSSVKRIHHDKCIKFA